MSRSANRTTAGPGHRTEILSVRGELDLATAGSLYRRGHAAMGRHTRLLLLDLTGLFFCDASGLTAFVRIANEADAAGCRYGLIAPQPPVAKMLRITGLHQRLHVYATIDQARQHPTPLTATAPAGKGTATAPAGTVGGVEHRAEHGHPEKSRRPGHPQPSQGPPRPGACAAT
jgi:anti-anti-sigma factor